MSRKPDIREYTRAFYRGNRLTFAAAIFTTVLAVIPSLVFSWLLGAIIDTVAGGQLQQLLRLLVRVTIPLLLFIFLLDLGQGGAADWAAL